MEQSTKTVDVTDQRKRIAEALNTTIVMPDGSIKTTTNKWDRHDEHRFLYNCAMCQGDVETITTVVLAALNPPTPPAP